MRVESSMHIMKMLETNKHGNKHEGKYHDKYDDEYDKQPGAMHGSKNGMDVFIKKMTIMINTNNRYDKIVSRVVSRLSDPLGALGGVLGIPWGPLGPSWKHLGSFFDASWRSFGALGCKIGFGLRFALFPFSGRAVLEAF